jgi:hypothetical protein
LAYGVIRSRKTKEGKYYVQQKKDKNTNNDLQSTKQKCLNVSKENQNPIKWTDNTMAKKRIKDKS